MDMLESLAAKVADHFHVPVAVIKTKCRKNSYIFPRFAYVYICRKVHVCYGVKKVTQQALAVTIDRTHADVLNAERKAADYYRFDPSFRKEMDSLLESLKLKPEDVELCQGR